MAKREPVRLLAGELEMLEVLWREGAVTISEAQQGLGREQGYTTVQTRLDRLVAKKLVTKSRKRPAKYKAKVKRDDVSRDDLNVLVRRVTGGRVVPLIAQLVKEHELTDEDISEIRDLIKDAEKRRTEADS
ncbi:MAG: BlaI/MecI/CopY family transcriptional regulator [Planctomycetaceae bacterium]